ncbi:hypothetical protein OZX73_08025 [Bifidobacterium sp. ESL0775]|uniref:hypothetical protein n=1 Tax=Bifidobacterium sp. ESL0775 TaxID=2983230 RepID=UPI0023F97C27|nr:hypothetical protein [Bifidobacterium sp. ESL0775]WEV69191.1 hypothetical protein OZX73_08025 [Bifidobacterium sp. ESL0775]
MGFDLFMGGLAVVLAALATWLIILFFRSPTSAQSPVETALQGLRNPNSSSDAPSMPTNKTLSGNAADGDMETEQNGETEAQISRISRLLILAIVLAVVVFVPSLLSRFSATLVPSWLVNPWVQAILTTPTMFLCGAPIHREGWHALSRRTPDVNSLISLGATGAFIYSLAICVARGQFPEGSRHAYFGGVNLIIALALAIELVELLILRDVEKTQNSIRASQGHLTAPQSSADALQSHAAASQASATASSPTPAMKEKVTANNNSATSSHPDTAIGANAGAAAHAIADRAFNTLIAGIRKLAHFTRIFVITVIVIAVWAFALLVAFGPQPRLTLALFGGVGVLVIAGFILAILALVLIINGRRKAQRDNNN